MKTADSIQFCLNGQQISVAKSDANATTLLVDYLRDTSHLTGTKWMCREGGCGACVVTMVTSHPTSEERHYQAVNSCLLPLMACHGKELITIEGIGSKKDGYHPVQSQLADMNGSQCGYCSPGMVMSMYSLLQEKGSELTMNDVEKSLEGNICRCTGYRPIMDAFKTFAGDATTELKSQCVDIEDLANSKINGHCRGKSAACSGKCSNASRTSTNDRVESGMLQLDNWYRPDSLNQLMELLASFEGQTKYRLVAGNTATGVYKKDGPYDAYVDLSGVSELSSTTESTPLTVGGAVSLTRFQQLLLSAGASNPDYWYASVLAQHIAKIASVPVRNLGSVAGNLMIKHAHNEFPSDLFLVLETVAAQVVVKSHTGEMQSVSLTQFLKCDMRGKLILSLTLPPLSTDYVVKTYKIMPRSANAHAYINAGFCARFRPEEPTRICGKPTVVFGGIRDSMVHAEETESFLENANLADEKQFQQALDVLQGELNPQMDLMAPDEEYLTSVAKGLLYKFALHVVGEKASAHVRTGAHDLERGLSSGKQEFDTDEKEWPVNKPTIKAEARAQCSGEAEYVPDIAPRCNEVHAVFVVSSMANCEIESIDSSAAEESEGFIKFIHAGNNQLGNLFAVTGGSFDIEEDEEVFCSGKVKHAGQAIGLVVASTRTQAVNAAKLVQIKYKNRQPVVLTIKDAMKTPQRVKLHTAFAPPFVFDVGNTEEGFTKSTTVVEGEFEIGNQYHVYMETLTSVCYPTEDGIEVYCTSQDITAVQTAVASSLNLLSSQVNVVVRRLGGAYGGKISRGTHIATACAIAAYTLGKPVRVQLDLADNMMMVGGRLPYYCKYKAGVDEQGLLQAVDMSIYSDCGYNFNEGTSFFAASFAKNCYLSASWKFRPYLVKTDTPSNTYCRAPGTTQGIAVIENLIEHVAKACNQDPFVFRQKNFKSESYPDLQKIINQVVISSDYHQRLEKVKEFNANNRWKKRGINLLPMVYPCDYPPFKYNVLVAIYQIDGSVVVSHGGIECGQGINTKLMQVVAREFGIPVSSVTVKSTNTLTNANGSATGGSVTSELNCYAAIKSCAQLKERMRPMKEKMPDADWKTLVKACFNTNVDLTARHYYAADEEVKGYIIHGATVTEVELDVLTGEKLIHRVDILEDAGRSISPLVDVGQVEGAFMMGIGLWTSEKITYDPTTGEKLTNGTWHYKPPLNRDIPIDFRVTLLKNSANSSGVLRSKATGEPPICMSISVLFALRYAIDAARKDAGQSSWFQLNGPGTIDKLLKMSSTRAEHLTFSN